MDVTSPAERPEATRQTPEQSAEDQCPTSTRCGFAKAFSIVTVVVIITMLVSSIVLYNVFIDKINRTFTGSCSGGDITNVESISTQSLSISISKDASMKATLVKYASLSYDLYCKSTDAANNRSWVPKGSTFSYVSKRKSQFFALANGPVLTLSFRGTYNYTDVVTDSKSDQVAPSFPCKSKNIANTKVHRGFDKKWKSLSEEVKECMASARSSLDDSSGGFTRILITGHSLGAAMALMCAVAMRCDPHAYGIADGNSGEANTLLICTVFACPKTGNASFTSAAKELLAKDSVCIVTNTADAVPIAPPGLDDDYFHIQPDATADRCSALHSVYTFHVDQGTWLKNHSIDLYASVLTSSELPKTSNSQVWETMCH